MYILQTLWDAICAVLGWFWQIAVAFGPHLGISEAISKFVLASMIIAVLATNPFSVSRRDRKSARNIASVVVDLFSYIRK